MVFNAEIAEIRSEVSSPQVFVEKFESARPRQFGGVFVITRRRVVVEAVLFALVHVQPDTPCCWP